MEEFLTLDFLMSAVAFVAMCAPLAMVFWHEDINLHTKTGDIVSILALGFFLMGPVFLILHEDYFGRFLALPLANKGVIIAFCAALTLEAAQLDGRQK